MRAILIVLDSVGVGELPDAEKYGDTGSNTLINIAKNWEGNLNLQNMKNLGLGNIDGLDYILDKSITPKGAYAKLSEMSKGKDTTIGHWEIAGIITDEPLPTYPNGFPDEIISEFERQTGRKTIGNCAASGTEIIENLGAKHVNTGDLIVYTSADSVFQIAAHEEVVPIETLYKYCEIARNILTGKHAVARVIARPFVGDKDSFKRTKNRKDFSLNPPSKTMLDHIKNAGLTVAAVGKIEDIFAGFGITKAVHTSGNMDGVDKTLAYMNEVSSGLIFTNLVDFDMLYGHRNDIKNYGNSLEEFDKRLPEIISNLKKDDILMITADHGCDPTTPSTDHSREYIPLLVFGEKIKPNINMGTRNSFADISATILEYLDVKGEVKGNSFLKDILTNN